MQLQMIWPASKWNAVIIPPLVPGYLLRTARLDEEQAINEILLASGFSDWTSETYQQWFDKVIPDGLWLIEHAASGQAVCCTWACHRRMKRHPYGGELGWVGCRPEHTGKGLAAVTCAAVVRRFRQAGYRCIYLQTDDQRLPALKTYLKLGWIPNVMETEPDMPGRWQAVCEKLGWTCNLEGWAREVEATRARW